jgi:hypothetical protein
MGAVMRRSPEHRDDDLTAEAAVGNVAGESLLATALARVDDELDRVIVLAHFALEMPLVKLARELNLERHELKERIESALRVLREDEALAAQLGDVRRAGEHEHYQALAFRLNLQDWLCSQCGGLMAQRGIGRPRRTCSSRCRRLLYEAGGVSWKDQHERGTTLPTPGLTGSRTNRALDTAVGREKLRLLMRPIETGLAWTAWGEPTVRFRDRAMLLLGFSCPVQLAPSDLAALDVHDIRRTTQGLEVRVFKRAARATQYVTVPMAADPALCPVQAMAPWRSLMIRNGRTPGPLFARINSDGYIAVSHRPLGGRAIAEIVNDALWQATRTRTVEITASMLFADFLERLRLDRPRTERITKDHDNIPPLLGFPYTTPVDRTPK